MNTARPCSKGDLRRSRLRRWAASQRRPAASHFVRGLCYGAGTLAASAAAIWLQQRF
ncbi:hypothetical protein [Streptomyces atratus]|uniref:hypothetical protein n=1 Tax=Streptomyces atratus TaxID=1893 RepID=UPI00225431EF|nr:hypothetical protein [Streptomyces atratus]MCX5346077.1 hypothetical protein [Streptomyces atratus]